MAKQPTSIFPIKTHAYSDVYASRTRAIYSVGRPDGALARNFNLSKDEAEQIVTNLPEELLEVVKEHYGLVEGEKEPETEQEVEEVEEVKEDESVPSKTIEEMTARELKDLARQLEIPYSNKSKDEMVESINKFLDESDDDE